ncbi:MAG: c-type cytochrome [Nitrospira sp.]|nr:c-type cytochrome [Nitrospira sp.]
MKERVKVSSRNRFPFLLSLLLLSTLSGGWSAARADEVKGKSLYANLCVRCHGVDGRGQGVMKFNPPVADLTAPAVQGKLDATLMREIHDGRKNTAMGAWKFLLSDEEIRDVTGYLRTLGSGSRVPTP